MSGSELYEESRGWRQSSVGMEIKISFANFIVRELAVTPATGRLMSGDNK